MKRTNRQSVLGALYLRLAGCVRKEGSRDGVMLAEVVISIVLLSMAAVAVVSSVVVSRHLTYANAQRVAAFGLARARLEELKGLRYETIDPADYTQETNIRFAHLGGSAQKALEASRTTTLVPRTDPTRMEANVVVQWTSQGRDLQESVTTFIYPR